MNRWRHAIKPEDLDKKTERTGEESADHTRAVNTKRVGTEAVESADQQAASEILAGG